MPQPKPIPNLQVSENSQLLRLPFYLGSREDTQPPNRPILERTVRFQRQLLKGEPIFMQVQVDERGIMSVEGWPKANPDQKFTVSIDPNQPAAVNETSNGLTRNPGEFDRTESDSRTDDTREEEQSTPGAEQPFVPSGSQAASESQGSILEVYSELMEMKKNISHYMNTSEFNRKKIIDEQIIRQHVRITEASNAEDFISPLLDNINYVNNYGRGKTIMLLGDLANLCSDIDLLYDIYDTAAALSSPEEIKSKHPVVIKNVVTNAIKTIGKTGLPSAESHLINLITQEIPTTVRPIAVYAIGKCCHGVNALEHLKRLMKYGEATDHVAINWAFGKMGSREHETPLSIRELESVISILIDQLQTEPDNDVKRNGIYALGEICDRRDCARDVIDAEKSKDVIRCIAPFLNASTDCSLADLANMQRIHAIKKSQICPLI